MGDKIWGYKLEPARKLLYPYSSTAAAAAAAVVAVVAYVRPVPGNFCRPGRFRSVCRSIDYSINSRIM